MSQIYTERRRTAEKPAAAPQVQSARESAAPMSAVAPQSVTGQRTDLPDAVRQKMENAFGADFSSVELYESQAVADAGAEAVAMGNRIAFAPDAASLSSAAGQELLGHELSHVVSQARGEVQGRGFLNDRTLEARADREGAMAAAGESIYTGPVTPLSASSVASAAGPMQAKKKEKKDTSVTQTPGVLTAQDKSEITSFKPGIRSETIKGQRVMTDISVGAMATQNGNRAVLKMGADPELESVYADILNAAGDVYARDRSKGWTFDAPAARGLTQGEREGNIGTLVKKKDLHSRDDTGKTTDESELNNATVFAMAGGNSADGAKAALKSIKGKEKDDYQRMMGYVTVVDALMGNYDRVIRNARGNWNDDVERQQVHLIDNDDQGAPSLRNAEAGRADWAASFYNQVSSSGQYACSPAGMTDFINNCFLEPTDLFSGKGVEEGFEDLSKIKEAMISRFTKANSGGELNRYQKEILQRVDMAQEMMKPVTKEQGDYYKELTRIGLSPERKNELLQQIEAERVHASPEKYGGQTHGAKPTATSGADWTRGTAADWLAAPGGAQPQPRQTQQPQKKKHRFWKK